jgi:hypothetical protein
MGYYEENREARLNYQKAYNEANKEKISNYFKNYYIKNYGQFMTKNRMYSLNRKHKIKSNKKLETKPENSAQKIINNLVTF